MGNVAALLDHDWERLVTFHRFPKADWKHLRTTAAKRYKRVANVTAAIWKTLLLTESRFLRLDAPQLPAEVAEGRSTRIGNE